MRAPGMSTTPRVAIEPGGGDAQAAFATMVHDVFDATPLDPAGGADAAAVSIWHLGTTMVGTFRGPPTRFVRDAARVATSGLDQFLVQLYVEGGFDGVAGDTPITVAPGDICVFDLTGTLDTVSVGYANISILVPRDALAGVMTGVEDDRLHGAVLPGGGAAGALLGDHLRALVDRVQTLGAEALTSAAPMTFAIVAAAVGGLMRTRAAAARPGARGTPLARALDYITAQIGDPRLDVDAIAAASGCSRAALFRLFARLGGVERHIRRQRLAGAARDLSDPAHARRIGDVAHRWGFASDAAFSRAFRQAFGMTPRAARQHNLVALLGSFGPEDGASSADRRFAAWLRSLPVGETLEQ